MEKKIAKEQVYFAKMEIDDETVCSNIYDQIREIDEIISKYLSQPTRYRARGLV